MDIKQIGLIIIGMVLGAFVVGVIRMFQKCVDDGCSTIEFEKWWKDLPDDWCEDLAKLIASKSWHACREYNAKFPSLNDMYLFLMKKGHSVANEKLLKAAYNFMAKTNGTM